VRSQGQFVLGLIIDICLIDVSRVDACKEPRGYPSLPVPLPSIV